MAFNYTGLKGKAETLIAKFGQSATLRAITNTGTDWAPSLTETDTTITVVDVNREVRDAAGTLTGQTRRTLYVSTAAGVTPAKKDKVVIGGTEHEIDAVRELSPGGTTLLFECDLAI